MTWRFRESPDYVRAMYYPLTVRDFLDRAEHVYPDRLAVVDEPDQPAPSLGELTYRDLAANARAQAAKLDELGVPVGGRVAVISQNSARLLASFFGVSGWGRILVPINFRLSRSEIQYIVGHSGADVVYADPALKDTLDSLDAKHKFTLGEDDALYLRDVEPRAWADPDEGATATINYTSGTTARPKGVQLTHRNNWLNATVFGLHTTISDRDVYLHTLPMFHANGWGMPFGVTGVGGKHIVLRQVDGSEILRRIDKYGVTLMCAAPAVIAAALDAAQTWHGEIPGRDRVRIIAEVPKDSSFWAKSPAVQDSVLLALEHTGAQVVVSPEVPPSAVKRGWRLAGADDYGVFWLGAPPPERAPGRAAALNARGGRPRGDPATPASHHHPTA